ncbi:GDSL esterase/lipase CPRD49-like [Vigna unguiculata]|nr:GDSL esterase/lipase CPRD49-like [Vigna unguiculata]
MIGPSRPQFVLFGSSIVQYSYYEGWGATISHVYARKADIVLRGYAAWNSRRALEVLDTIFPKDAIEQPSLVIVYFGGNDSSIPNPNGIGPHVPLDEYKENMRKIATHVKNLSEKTRVIFLTTPPINEAQIPHNIVLGELERTNEACRIYAEACMEVSREMNIKGIDLWSAIQKIDNWQDVCFIDGIHLTNVGSKVVSKEILDVLKEANWEPSLYWRAMPSEFGEDSPYDVVEPDGKTTFNMSDLIFPDNDQWD